jgi:hypothetical protein
MQGGVPMEELGKKIDTMSNELTQLRLEIWRKYTLFTWQWWVFAALCVIFLVLFVILIDRKKYLQAIAYLGVIYILNKNLDDLATAMDWYDYRMQLEPIIPTFLPANLFVIPIAYSVIYQHYEKWKSFFISTVVFSGFVAYVALPLAKLAKIYLEKTWNSHLSFISLLIMASLSKILIDKVKSLYSKG